MEKQKWRGRYEKYYERKSWRDKINSRTREEEEAREDKEEEVRNIKWEEYQFTIISKPIRIILVWHYFEVGIF